MDSSNIVLQLRIWKIVIILDVAKLENFTYIKLDGFIQIFF